MSNWNPITLSALERLVASCLTEMPESSVALLQQYKVDYFQLPCIRSLKTGQESLFVVAAYEDKVLIFDDVEEEFGIATVSQDGILKNWKLYGDLRVALENLISP